MAPPLYIFDSPAVNIVEQPEFRKYHPSVIWTFFHLERTGGMALIQHLKAHLGDKCVDVGRSITKVQIHDGARVIVGRASRPGLVKNSRYFTYWRDPAERLWSQYQSLVASKFIHGPRVMSSFSEWIRGNTYRLCFCLACKDNKALPHKHNPSVRNLGARIGYPNFQGARKLLGDTVVVPMSAVEQFQNEALFPSLGIPPLERFPRQPVDEISPENRALVYENHPEDVAIHCEYMARPLRSLRNSKAGRCVILLSGTTAGEQPLERISCPMIGVNESFRRVAYPRTFAHVLSDSGGIGRYGQQVADSWPDMILFVKDGMLVDGAKAKTPQFGRNTFALGGSSSLSFDLESGIYRMGGAVMALQVAVYLGFEEIVFIGLDLKLRGDRWHFWDQSKTTKDVRHDYRYQLEALRMAADVLRRERPDVRVVNVSHDTACDAFPVVGFDEVFTPS